MIRPTVIQEVAGGRSRKYFGRGRKTAESGLSFLFFSLTVPKKRSVPSQLRKERKYEQNEFTFHITGL